MEGFSSRVFSGRLFSGRLFSRERSSKELPGRWPAFKVKTERFVSNVCGERCITSIITDATHISNMSSVFSPPAPGVKTDNFLISLVRALDFRGRVCQPGAFLIRESISPIRFPGPVPWWGAGPSSLGRCFGGACSRAALFSGGAVFRRAPREAPVT